MLCQHEWAVGSEAIQLTPTQQGSVLSLETCAFGSGQLRACEHAVRRVLCARFRAAARLHKRQWGGPAARIEPEVAARSWAERYLPRAGSRCCLLLSADPCCSVLLTAAMAGDATRCRTSPSRTRRGARAAPTLWSAAALARGCSGHLPAALTMHTFPRCAACACCSLRRVHGVCALQAPNPRQARDVCATASGEVAWVRGSAADEARARSRTGVGQYHQRARHYETRDALCRCLHERGAGGGSLVGEPLLDCVRGVAANKQEL